MSGRRSTRLSLVGTTTIRATTTPFVAKEKFVVTDGFLSLAEHDESVKICALGEYFEASYLGKVEEPIDDTVVQRYQQSMGHPWVHAPIVDELGGEAAAETTLTELFSLMEKQPNGEKGVLFTSGAPNFFYVRDLEGTLNAICAYWDSPWVVGASALDYKQYFSVAQIFKRKALVPLGIQPS